MEGELDNSRLPQGSVIISEDEINVLLNTLPCIHTHTQVTYRCSRPWAFFPFYIGQHNPEVSGRQMFEVWLYKFISPCKTVVSGHSQYFLKNSFRKLEKTNSSACTLTETNSCSP